MSSRSRVLYPSDISNEEETINWKYMTNEEDHA